MSGIAATYCFERTVEADWLDQMLVRARHRGDERTQWTGKCAALGVCDADRREIAHQVVTNGTLYNSGSLRRELVASGRVFTGESDAEVIRNAYEQWGVDCVRRFNGAFAFALWDEKTRSLFCARDQVGLKPLFYASANGVFACASEPKMIFGVPVIAKRPNEGLIGDYLSGRLHYNTESFFEGVCRLLPAHYLIVRADGSQEVRRYWDVREGSADAPATLEGCAEKFLELIQNSLKARLNGVTEPAMALSGGLDSPSLLILTEELLRSGQNGRNPVQTFSLVYSDKFADERDAIELVVKQTGANASFLTVDTGFAFDDLRKMIRHLDEPVVSLGVIIWWYIKKLAHQHGARRLINGHGPDELFAGINLNYFSDLIRSFDFGTLGREVSGYRQANYYQHNMSATSLIWNFGVKPLVPTRIKRLFKPGIPEWIDGDFARKVQLDRRLEATVPRHFPATFDQIIYEAFVSSFTPLVLNCEEACAAAFNIENSSPYLDVPLVEFAFSLPREMKIREGMTKLVQREAMQAKLPATITTKTEKTLIPTVIDHWLRDTSWGQIEEIYWSSQLRQRGYVDCGKMDEIFKRYGSGGKGSAGPEWTALNPLRRPLWRAVGLELWFQECMDK